MPKKKDPSYDYHSLVELIPQLIREENEYQPLSDDAIANWISEEYKLYCNRAAINYARRLLGIASSSKRKKEYRGAKVCVR